MVRSFVEATICRDKLRRFDEAFKNACKGIIGLLANDHGDLAAVLARGTPRPTAVPLRRLIWSFVRNSDTGLPSGRLLANSEWHPILKARVTALVQDLEKKFSFKQGENLGKKLANRALSESPIVELPDLAGDFGEPIQVSTVHKVKGQSIDAVMYVADKGQIREMLDGTGTEDGRIGYVAATRARDLFVLAVPENCVDDFEPELIACGFQKAGARTTHPDRTDELQEAHVLAMLELRPDRRSRN